VRSRGVRFRIKASFYGGRAATAVAHLNCINPHPLTLPFFSLKGAGYRGDKVHEKTRHIPKFPKDFSCPNEPGVPLP